jgi:general secretion pathway protein C
MDVLLKKYFWIFSLAAVAVCATLGGRTASRLISQSWFGAEDPAVPSRRGFTPQAVEKVHSKEVEKIIERDVFCSSCAPIKEETDTPDGDSGPASTEPRKSDLAFELISTMVVPYDEDWSFAVIRETSSKDKETGMYRRRAELPGGAATVLRVIDKKVYLNNNNRIEYIEMDGATPPKPMAVAAAEPIAFGGPAEPLDGDINRGVRCNGANCEIDRSLVDKLLQNTTMLATAARFVPSIKDGRPNGFKLYAIRPSSIFGKIGLQNGDTVKTINGMEMSSPDQALGVYTKLRTASHLSVAVERRGETVSMDYTIR